MKKMKTNARLVKSLIGKNVIRTRKKRDGSLFTKTYKIVEVEETRYMGMGFDLVMQPETHTWAIISHELSEDGKVKLGHRNKPCKMSIELGHEIPLVKENVLRAMELYNSSLIEDPNNFTIII